MDQSKHRVISVLIENAAGALPRVVGLFSQRGFNIDSLNVAPTEDRTLSRITLTTRCNNRTLEQIVKQLHSLIDVLKVQEINSKRHVERELMLIKVKAANAEEREEIFRCIQIFRGQVVDMGPNYFILAIVGNNDKIDNFLEIINEFKILEVARTGVSGLTRDDKALSV